MSYIIVTRNPSSRTVVVIMDGEEVADFPTEQAATDAAHDTTVCKAWGFEVVEIGGDR